jgi:exonuclease SbcC
VRPLRLELKGFTAFREPAEIDFTKLDVFAISGPTGSGKSSLLDAMTYALYGRVERVGDRVSQLVSQGRPRMAVTLEFEVGHDRYRVTRSSPSSRGATKILLERYADGAWIQAGEGADRVKEVERMLARAIGLTYDGFTRSVVLPQGKFAEFLVGEAKKRRDILTELLGLSLFRRMAERAGAIAKESSVRAQERGLTLDREYSDATPEALKEAKAAAREAVRQEKVLAAAAERVIEIMARWQEAGRSADEIRACAEETAQAAETAAKVVEELIELSEAWRAAEERLGSSAAASEAAAEALERARIALREADHALGPADALGRALAAAHRREEAVAATRRRESDRARLTEAAGELEAALGAAGSDLEARRGELAARLTEAESAEAALETARHADLVAAVSSGLKPGDPCPVCGEPLERVPKKATGTALTKATRAREASAKAVDAAREAAARVERTVDVLRRDLEANGTDLAGLATEIEELARTVAATEDQVKTVLGDPLPPEPVAEIERRSAERARLEQAERDAERAAADAATVRLRAEQERERVMAVLARQRDRLDPGLGSLFSRIARATDGRVAPPAFAGPPDAGPEELRAYGAHVASDLAALTRLLDGEVAQEGSLELRLLDEATQVVGDLVEPVHSLEALAGAMTMATRAATAEVATATQRAEDLATRVQRRKDLAEEVAELEARARLFRTLALELRADRLIAFLQAEALQVLATAGSDRLASLSDGRYRLVCRDDEFLVVDTWNGDEERSVRTLSGGETFLASLALALALAEQVRSLSVTDRARLDSLFLDEGFGTLDPETLRTVVDAIEQLAGDGRLVGVITHVPELAEQFPRVEVRKDRMGSRLEVVA